MEIIQVQNLTYTIDDIDILKKVNLSFEKGKFTSIIGPNGAGKTTLIELITKIIKQTEGHIYVKNKDIKTLKSKEMAKIISYVPQNIKYDYEFSVEDIVLMGRIPHQKMLDTYTPNDLKIVVEAMKKTGIYGLKNRNVCTLSGGEQQRVAIARALAQQTEIMILDEPISNLDIYQQIAIMDLLKKLKEEENLTIICILHDINTSLKYADKTVLLKNGEFIKEGNSADIITPENMKNLFSLNVKIIQNESTKIAVY